MKVTNTPVQGIPQIEKTQKAGARKVDAESTKTGKALAGADIEISDDARLFQKALDLVKSLPEADKKQKLAELKQSIASGQYKTDAAALADKLLDEHLKTDFGKNNI